MKRILITIDDEAAKVLAKSVNQSETVRQALRIYQDDITTDTLAGMRVAFNRIIKEQQESARRFTELYELVESLKATIDELAHR